MTVNASCAKTEKKHDLRNTDKADETKRKMKIVITKNERPADISTSFDQVIRKKLLANKGNGLINL